MLAAGTSIVTQTDCKEGKIVNKVSAETVMLVFSIHFDTLFFQWKKFHPAVNGKRGPMR